jgi:hypothetical protein
MTAWKRRSLAVLMLMLVAISSPLNLAVAVSAHADTDVLSPFVLVEAFEEGEIEESNEFVLLTDTKPCVFAFEVTYAAHIAEECEFDRARHRKAHFLRGPPVA